MDLRARKWQADWRLMGGCYYDVFSSKTGFNSEYDMWPDPRQSCWSADPCAYRMLHVFWIVLETALDKSLRCTKSKLPWQEYCTGTILQLLSALYLLFLRHHLVHKILSILYILHYICSQRGNGRPRLSVELQRKGKRLNPTARDHYQEGSTGSTQPSFPPG